MSFIQRNFTAFVKRFAPKKAKNVYNLAYKQIAADMYWESGDGWTLRELADYLGIPKKTLEHWVYLHSLGLLTGSNAIAVSHRKLSHAA